MLYIYWGGGIEEKANIFHGSKIICISWGGFINDKIVGALQICITGMSIFMAFFVQLLIFEGNMPPASDNIPIMGKCGKTYMYA